jgi:hypothetical protein
MYVLEGFKSHPSGSGAVIVDNKNKYAVPFEEGTFGDQTIHAYLLCNENPIETLYVTDASLRKDTLEILIFGFNGVESQQYLIRVHQNKYSLGYQIQSTMDAQIELDNNTKIDRKISPSKTMVKLNTLKFQKGVRVRGYTEFEGKCVSGCGVKPFEVKIKGNFSALIK